MFGAYVHQITWFLKHVCIAITQIFTMLFGVWYFRSISWSFNVVCSSKIGVLTVYKPRHNNIYWQAELVQCT